MQKEQSLLEMDFGEMVEYGDSGVIQALDSQKSGDTEEQENTSTEDTKQEDEFNIDVNEVFSGENKKEEEDTGTEKDEQKEDEQPGSKEDDSEKGSPDSGSKKEAKKEDDTSGVPFTLVFARYQLEQGNLSELDEEALKEVIENEGESAAMSYLFQNEVELNRKQYLSQYDEDAKELKEYMELKDAGVDTETAKQLAGNLADFAKVKLEDLEEEDNVDLRRKVITQNYRNSTRFTDAKIKKLVDNAVSLGDDIDEAKEALENVNAYNKEAVKLERERKEQEATQFEEAHRAQIKAVKDQISSLTEVLPGHKINKQTKQKIEDMLLKPAGQDAKGNQVNKVWQKRLDNPLDFDIKLAYLLATGYFDGKTDKIEKVSKSKMMDELEKHIEGSGRKFQGKQAARQQDSGEEEAAIASMKKAFGF